MRNAFLKFGTLAGFVLSETLAPGAAIDAKSKVALPTMPSASKENVFIVNEPARTVYYFNGPPVGDRAIQTAPLMPSETYASAAKIAWPAIVDRVRFLPAPDREQAMVGGRFTGSNVSPFEGFKVLAEIITTPKRNEWNEIKFANTTPCRWVRYEAPPGSHGNVAELRFCAGDAMLNGVGFGSPGMLRPGILWKGVFDGNPATWFNSSQADGQYAGLDLGNLASAWQPAITPAGGNFETPQIVRLASRTPDETIRYTLDGTTPGPNDGQLYTAPIKVEKNTTVVAVSFKQGLAPSPASVATIWIGPPARAPLHSFHVGNSLTRNASLFSTFIRTAGGEDNFPAYLISGSQTAELWNKSQGDGNKRWTEIYSKAGHPLDYFTIQPRDFNVAEEADYATRFIKLVRENSPGVQPWLYAEWDEMDRARPTDKGEVPSFQMKKTFPALTWQESMSAMMLYDEEVRHRIIAQYPEGKPARIISTALALGLARSLIDQGKFPGVAPGETNFRRAFFEDTIHANPAGCYLVACTWYAALCRESPEDKLLPIGTRLTSEQARVLQRLAWDVVSNYPDCGLYEEGSQSCGKPEFTMDSTVITLKSATPGAWFRYTLDGTTPTRTNGYVYCGVISVQPGIRPRAVSYKSGMMDSVVAEMGATGAKQHQSRIKATFHDSTNKRT